MQETNTDDAKKSVSHITFMDLLNDDPLNDEIASIHVELSTQV